MLPSLSQCRADHQDISEHRATTCEECDYEILVRNPSKRVSLPDVRLLSMLDDRNSSSCCDAREVCPERITAQRSTCVEWWAGVQKGRFHDAKLDCCSATTNTEALTQLTSVVAMGVMLKTKTVPARTHWLRDLLPITSTRKAENTAMLCSLAVRSCLMPIGECLPATCAKTRHSRIFPAIWNGLLHLRSITTRECPQSS